MLYLILFIGCSHNHHDYWNLFYTIIYLLCFVPFTRIVNLFILICMKRFAICEQGTINQYNIYHILTELLKLWLHSSFIHFHYDLLDACICSVIYCYEDYFLTIIFILIYLIINWSLKSLCSFFATLILTTGTVIGSKQLSNMFVFCFIC